MERKRSQKMVTRVFPRTKDTTAPGPGVTEPRKLANLRSAFSLRRLTALCPRQTEPDKQAPRPSENCVAQYPLCSYTRQSLDFSPLNVIVVNDGLATSRAHHSKGSLSASNVRHTGSTLRIESNAVNR